MKSFRTYFDAEILYSLRWQYFLNIGIGILGAAYLLALSRLMGPEDFGTYTLCAALPTVAAALLDSRLQEFVLYISENCDRSKYPRILAALFWFDAFSKLLVVCLALAAFAALNARGYSGIYLSYVFLSAVLVFVGKSFSGPAMGTLRSCGKLEYFSTVQVIDWVFRLIALGALFLAGRVTIANVIVSQIVVAGVFNLVVVRRATSEINMTAAEFIAGPTGVLNLLKRYARLIFANQGISAMEAVVKELDVIVSGVFLTTVQIATYKVAKSIAGVAWRLADPILIVILPKMAKLHASGRTSELNGFVRALSLGLAPSAILLFGASVAGVLLLGPFVLGPDYAEAITVYPFAAAWILIALPLVWTHSLSVATGRPGLFFLGSGFGNGIGLLAICLGAWQYGVAGALVGLSLAYCLPFLFAFLLLRRFGVTRRS
jgi:O-antigen/teichoic acid export membrane protein